MSLPSSPPLPGFEEDLDALEACVAAGNVPLREALRCARDWGLTAAGESASEREDTHVRASLR